MMFFLVDKFKKYKNEELNQHEDAPLDPKESYEVKELDKTFEKVCDLYQSRIKIIGGFIEELEEFVGNNYAEGNNPEVNISVKDNLVARHILNNLRELDK
jgi:hypothetical protein